MKSILKLILKAYLRPTMTHLQLIILLQGRSKQFSLGQARKWVCLYPGSRCNFVINFRCEIKVQHRSMFCKIYNNGEKVSIIFDIKYCLIEVCSKNTKLSRQNILVKVIFVGITDNFMVR